MSTNKYWLTIIDYANHNKTTVVLNPLFSKSTAKRLWHSTDQEVLCKGVNTDPILYSPPPPSLIFLYSLVLLSVCTRNLSQAIPIVKHTCVFIVFNPYLQLNRGGGHTFECTKYHRIVHFKMVNFMLCELCVCVCVCIERETEKVKSLSHV